MNATYTVWVGGGEISENLMSLPQAQKIASVWRDLGYDDVQITQEGESKC